MSSPARKLVKKMAKDSDGYIPNIGNLDLRPGTILSRKNNRYDVVGALWERVQANGNASLAATIKTAMTRVDPNNADGDTSKHKLGLKYKANGTVMVASDVGFDVKISDVTVKANIKVDFKKKSDYLFDTTEPSPWYTFSDTEMDDVRAGALKYLEPGEYIVIGAVKAAEWVWYASKSANTTVAFAVAGDTGVSGLNVDKLADISAKVGLNVVVDSSAVVRGRGVNGIAAFRVLKKRKKLSGPQLFGLHAADVMIDGTIIKANAIEATLDDPTERELLELVGSDTDDEDDDD